MTKTMLKVTFEDLGARTCVKPMPKDAVIRHVGERHGRIILWFEADFDLMDQKDGESLVERMFVIAGNGEPIPDGAVYLGTVPMASFVWHVFEVTG